MKIISNCCNMRRSPKIRSVHACWNFCNMKNFKIYLSIGSFFFCCNNVSFLSLQNQESFRLFHQWNTTWCSRWRVEHIRNKWSNIELKLDEFCYAYIRCKYAKNDTIEIIKLILAFYTLLVLNRRDWISKSRVCCWWKLSHGHD